MVAKAPKKKINTSAEIDDADRRERFAHLHVLIADRDHRTAALVQRILFLFGLRRMDVTTNGESALTLLKSRPYDLIITEWNMVPVDGVALVRAIRGAKADKRIPRDIPIIMLTARADKESVRLARDAGITEFVAKPFSAKTISNRVIQIIDNPRSFVESMAYVGPCRRRKGVPPPGTKDRRVRDSILESDKPTLKQRLGNVRASEILNDGIVAQAQEEFLAIDDDFIDWARDDLLKMEMAFGDIKKHPDDQEARRNMLRAAYAIKSQAGQFGYTLGMEVATLMIDYLSSHGETAHYNITVLRKHIDTISTIFKEKIKNEGQAIAAEMLAALRKLTQKLG